MRIVLEHSGGFAAMPGLQRAIVLDTKLLPPAEASRVEQLVAETQVPHAGSGPPAPPAARRGAADMRSYRLTVEGVRQSRVLEFSDPIDDEALGALVAHLQGFGSSDPAGATA